MTAGSGASPGIGPGSLTKGMNNNNDNGGSGPGAPSSSSSFWTSRNNITSSMIFSGLPNLTTLCIQSMAFATITLYILNQKHMLPHSLSRVVSKALFYPTIPITIGRRIGKWTTVVDDAVVIGGAPFGWMNYPEKLSKQFNVKGVVNMCEEYRGPISSYKRLGIEHLRLPTVDHFEPSVEDLKKAVSFIQKHEEKGGRVYVHCRAGHGRSAAAVYAWLLYKEPLANPKDLNEKLCSLRDVRKSLYKQPNINVFRKWLNDGGMMSDSDSEDDVSEWLNKKQTQDTDSTDDEGGGGFGQVFSDENESSEEEEYYDREEYYDPSSDDEFDVDRDSEVWRRRNMDL